MTNEEIAGAVKKELLKRVTVEDGDIFISDKRGFAYGVFNIIERFEPEFIRRILEDEEYFKVKGD